LKLKTERTGVSQLPQFPKEDLCVQSLPRPSVSLQALQTKRFLLVHVTAEVGALGNVLAFLSHLTAG